MNTQRRNVNLEEFVLQLRAHAPIFGERIAGLSTFNNVTVPNLNLQVPYCVIHKVSNSGLAVDKARSTQLREALISFIVCVDNVKQKGSGAGRKAIQAADSVNPCSEQIENALLNWKPTNFDLADTPSFIDEGFLDMDNTRLWHEIVWKVPYVVYNSAFGGLGNPDFNDEESEEVPFTELAILYGVDPVPIFLDQWIYGPMTNPPPREDGDIEQDLENDANIYTMSSGQFVAGQRVTLPTISTPYRQQLIITFTAPGFDLVLPPPFIENNTIPDPGFVFVYNLQGEQAFTFTGDPVMVPERFAND